MEPHIRLTSAQSPQTTEEVAQIQDIPYHEAVGLLMYAALGTHPNIAFAVQTVSQFLSKPGIAHWDTIKPIFCYLKGTKDFWLIFGHEKTDLKGLWMLMGTWLKTVMQFLDVLIINGGAISWCTKCQEIVSLSTTESEYISITHTVKEILWIWSLFE
jgi:hypothetical protein